MRPLRELIMWRTSLTGRGLAALSRGLLPACRESLAGRILNALLAMLRPLLGGSAFLSLAASRQRSLSAEHGVLERWLGGLFSRARSAATRGRFGRLTASLGEGVSNSGFGQARWLRIPGAFLLGVASSLALRDQTLVQAAPGIVSGLVLITLSAIPTEWLRSRGLASAPPRPLRSQWIVWTGAVLALLAGVVSGLSSGDGSTSLVTGLAGLGLASVAVVLYRPEALLLAFAAFPWLDFLARRGLAGSSLSQAWDEALLLGSILLLALTVLLARRSRIYTVPAALPIFAAFTLAVGSVALNPVPGDVGIFALRVMFQPVLFYFLAFLLPKSEGWVKAAVVVFLAAGTLLALHGLYQYVTGAPMPQSWIDAHEAASIGTRAYSIIENPNGLGAFLAMGGLLAASVALARGKALVRWLAAAAFLAMVLGLAVTFSRGAWIGFAAGLIVLVALIRPRLLGLLLPAGALAFVVAPARFTERLTFAFSSDYVAKSLTSGRLLMWDLALRRAVEHPWFGVGLGTFGGTTASLYNYTTKWVDNFCLQTAAEGGLLLLFAWLWALLRIGKSLVASHRDVASSFARAVACGGFAAFVAVVVANATASVWETLSVGAGFWFLAGMASSLPMMNGPAALRASASPDSISSPASAEGADGRRGGE